LFVGGPIQQPIRRPNLPDLAVLPIQHLLPPPPPPLPLRRNNSHPTTAIGGVILLMSFLLCRLIYFEEKADGKIFSEKIAVP
jgi:hypothetical protein